MTSHEHMSAEVAATAGLEHTESVPVEAKISAYSEVARDVPIAVGVKEKIVVDVSAIVVAKTTLPEDKGEEGDLLVSETVLPQDKGKGEATPGGVEFGDEYNLQEEACRSETFEQVVESDDREE